MAPVGEKLTNASLADDKKNETGEQNLWATILSEVQSSSRNKLPSCKSIVVLGDNESGKTTLVAKLQGTEDSKKGAGLEYYYVDVRDEYRDDHTRLGVYVLDGEPSHAHLLKFTLSEKNFEHTTAVICVSMTQPWVIMESLQTWALILQEHIYQLKMPSEQLRDRRQKLIRRWQDYIEPGDELEAGTTALRRPTTGDEDPNSILPLPEDTLTDNLGIELVVVVTKTDFMSNLEKEYDYKDEHFDFIQQAVRKFCQRYGASLFYTSVKEDKNCDLLYKFLVHRIYGFPFRTPALVVEKDAVFIPMGWDNEKKITILYENLTSVRPDDFYSDVIAKPVVRKPVQRDVEVQAEEEQVFLTKQQSLLSQQPPQPGAVRPAGQESPMRTSAGVHKTSDRRISGSPGVQPTVSSPKKVDGTKVPAGTSEGVLANFFNSLLSKKTGAGAQTAIKASDKSVARSDVAAELDRMTRAKKSIPSQGATPPSSSPSSSPSNANSSF